LAKPVEECHKEKKTHSREEYPKEVRRTI